MIPLSLPTRLLILLAGLALAFAAGWRAANDHRDAQQLDAEREDAALYRAGTQRLLRLNQDIGRDLAAARQSAAAERRDYSRRLRDAHTLAVCDSSPGLRLPGAADPGPVSLTADFGRLYNDALAIGLPADLRAGGDYRADPWADPAATVTPEDVLDAAADNGEQCNDLRTRLIAAQRWARGIGAMP